MRPPPRPPVGTYELYVPRAALCLAGVLLVRTLFAAWQEQLPRPERRTNFQAEPGNDASDALSCVTHCCVVWRPININNLWLSSGFSMHIHGIVLVAMVWQRPLVWVRLVTTAVTAYWVSIQPIHTMISLYLFIYHPVYNITHTYV